MAKKINKTKEDWSDWAVEKLRSGKITELTYGEALRALLKIFGAKIVSSGSVSDEPYGENFRTVYLITRTLEET